MFKSRAVRHIIVTAAASLAPFVFPVAAQAKVVKAATPGDGIIAPSSGQCEGSNIDGTNAGWTWTKPTLEVSADNGATWTSAATYTFSDGKKFGAQVCRNLGGAGSSVSTQAYWFIIQPATGGSDDMGQAVVTAGLQFKVTVPMKSGDTALRMTGYSKVVSFQESSGTVTAIVKASQIAKVNMGGTQPFNVRHPECASVSDPNQCKVEKADRDLLGTVIQHIEFTTTTPTAWQSLSKGVWIGANVNGYQLTLTCATKGTDEGSSGGSNGGGSYSGNDGGANKPSGSTTPPSLSVAMSGTPHLRADGSINKGNLQAFVPEATARSCFGDGTDSISLATIAQNMSVSRTESSENGGTAQDLPQTAYTATAVTSPVAGLLIDVAEMTFSNPTYKVSSKLAQQLLASYTASSGAASNSTTGTTVSMGAKVKGTKVTLTITLGSAQKVKVYKKVGNKLTLVKTVTGKVGANTVVTPHKKGTTYIVKSATGKTLKSLKP